MISKAKGAGIFWRLWVKKKKHIEAKMIRYFDLALSQSPERRMKMERKGLNVLR